MPRLQATQLSGNPDAPIAVAELDITKLCQDPAMVEKMQDLAIAMAGYSDVVQMPKQLPAAEQE